jgi:hypothetical protein
MELITNPGDTNRMMQMITGYWVTQVVHAAATFSGASLTALRQDIAKRSRAWRGPI